MQCHKCGRTVEAADRFCTGCGTSLVGVTDTTQLVPVVGDGGQRPSATADPLPATAELPATELIAIDDGTDELPATELIAIDDGTDELPATELVAIDDGTGQWGDVDPVWASTGSTPVTSGAAVTGQLAGAVRPERAQTDAGFATATLPHQRVGTTDEIPLTRAVVAANRFRLGAMTLLGLLTAAVTLVALFANLISVTSASRLDLTNAPSDFRTGSWTVDDLAGNMAIAGLVASVLMAVGGVAAGFAWRWGAGLAGGAGLAFAGLAALAVGLAQGPIDAAHEFIEIPAEQEFILTITRDLGYWLFIVGGALGVVLFFASLNLAFGDRRPGLNPWIAALGALAAVVASAGPLLPERLGMWRDNWYVIDAPGQPSALLLAGRLLQLGLLGLSGVVGFLSVRRWGLGVAIGGALPSVWLAVSTLFELGDSPIGPGFRNPGAVDSHIHGVTIIGISAVFALCVLAAVSAYDQSVRSRR